jgi:osmotically-inducible protein OsmY
LTPTSGEPEQRVYTTDQTTVTAPTSVDTPPPGAAADNWNVAEAIRQKLTEDPTLAPLGSSLITQVGNDGVVTLKGSVRTEKEKQRVADAIASVPGVKSVNDEMKVGAYHGGGTLDMSK